MFNESGSFYYSMTGDLSNTMQRLFDGSIDKHLPIWNQVFFSRQICPVSDLCKRLEENIVELYEVQESVSLV